MQKHWDHWDDEQLEKLVETREYYYTEIAEIMKRLPGTVRHHARKLGLPRYPSKKKMGGWNNKHAHLREAVMTYYLTHSYEETMAAFKLTKSNLKSLLIYGYRDPKCKHLRKETRTHERWTAKNYQFMIQHLGMRPRQWIAKKMKRGGTEHAIKDRLSSLGMSSKSTNGITISQFREAFGQEPKYFIQTHAGPTRGLHGQTYWKIVPWVYLDKEIKTGRLKTSESFRLVVSTMAMFQNWIFEGDAIKKMEKIVK